MRRIINLNRNWNFVKGTSDITETAGEPISLPHTWNGKDGQDGGNDYFRGACLYTKTLHKSDYPRADRYFLEFLGANSSATVYGNGKELAHHHGGYSTFRVDITETFTEDMALAVVVDNSPNEEVYPQMADFTFYGGLYRDVNLICVPESHFDLEYYGGPGIAITPETDGKSARIRIEVFVTNPKENQDIAYTIFDGDGKIIGETATKESNVFFCLPKVHLWQGKKDPYLYRCRAELREKGEILDRVEAEFGCRTVAIHPERGFLLNGEPYPLRGVSRHQDWWGVGNALSPEHHRKDMDLILEVGANALRLAHYQHDGYFYDLCDREGMIVWAEIPYISKHMPEGRENTVSQMRELIVQNYNRPSIAIWGLSNEITIGGSGEDLRKNHRILNDLAHSLDKTRPTAIAAVSTCSPEEAYLRIPDAVAYNHYFGWYGGETHMNGEWFDEFHAKYPRIPIGMSEYGCEGLDWHTSHPRQGDYTEEYQAYYHEELIKQLFTREYLWCSFVWNMFDFGADARNEGGENGQNHKGLVTFDRSYKKDAFYAYKAWLSEDPFVHLCSKRYIDRTEERTKVTVYSNQPEVELFVNGKSVGKQRTKDRFFRFEIPNEGESVLLAVAGDCKDGGRIRKVDSPNENYLLKEAGAVLNWFDVTEREGYFSLNDKISDIMATPQGKAWFEKFGKKLQGGSGKAMGFEINDSIMKMMAGFTVLRMANMAEMMNISFTKEELLALNGQLNQIPKEP